MIELKYATLHNVLFLGGTNLQDKLDVSKRTGLRLVYDRKEGELLVEWAGETAIIPASNIASMIPFDPKDVGMPSRLLSPAAPQPKPKATGKPIVAQVSDPTKDSVFAGPGGGKFRD
jgi:hypothetical protein